jgi:hypothetical protein
LLSPTALHADAFARQRALMAVRLRSQATNPMAAAMHAVKNKFVYKVPFSFEEAALFVEQLDEATALTAFLARNKDATELLVRPCPTHEGFPVERFVHEAGLARAVGAPPEAPFAREGPHSELTMHKVAAGGATQAAVVIARAGLGKGASLDPHFTARRAVLGFICYGSLGSRLYRLREEKGLFYSASGAFNAGAPRAGSGGFDYIATQVEPRAVVRTLEELQAFCENMRDNPRITAAELMAARCAYDSTLGIALGSAARCAGLIVGLTQRFPDRPWQVALQQEVEAVRGLTVKAINDLARETYAGPHWYRAVAN